ncbi:MAG: GH3 auxin-responsive promoter family protein [Candidatus Sericytochromatia bacterium]
MRPLLSWYARTQARSLSRHPLEEAQTRVFKSLLQKSAGSRFFKDHQLDIGLSVADYQNRVPARDYEFYRQAYIEPHLDQLDGVLSNQSVIWLARTSGSSAGREKFMPVTTDFLGDNRRASLLQAQFNYLRVEDPRVLLSPVFWLTDMSDLFQAGGYQAATISRLMRHTLPPWINRRLFPPLQILHHQPASERFKLAVQAASERKFRFVSGITPWLLKFFEDLLALTGAADLKVLWPELTMISHAGVDFSLHEAKMRRLAGEGVMFVESYVATEGFIGFQDLDARGLRILPEHGLFYEFIRQADLHQASPRRYLLWEVEPGVPYSLYISNSSGLWSYEVGDFIVFDRLEPWPLFRVIGRVHEKFDFFGEKVLIDEIRKSLQLSNQQHAAVLNHFHVGADFEQTCMLLLLDFDRTPQDLAAYLQAFDLNLRPLNDQYRRNRVNSINQPPQAIALVPGAFQHWMDHSGQTRLQAKAPQMFHQQEAFQQLLAYFRQHQLIEQE